MHMLGLALLPTASTADAQPTIDDEQQLDKRQHVVYLRSRNVVAVDRVWDTSDAERRPLRFSWYPGDAWITLLETTVPRRFTSHTERSPSARSPRPTAHSGSSSEIDATRKSGGKSWVGILLD